MCRGAGAVGDDRIDLRVCDHSRHVYGWGVRGTEHDPACDAVELQKGQHRGQLPVTGDQDRRITQ